MCGGHLPLSTTYYRLGAGRRLHVPPATYRLLPTTRYLPPLDDLLLLRTFWKHEPPKPTLALRNLEPMRVSTPMACATSFTLAPVTW